MATPRQRTKFALNRLPVQVRLRGRTFSRSELRLIRSFAKQYANAGRTHISERVCKALNWKQPNGWLKDRACRDVLRALHKAKLIRLPEPKVSRKVPLYSKWKPLPSISRTRVAKISEISDKLTLRLAKGNSDEKVWNTLVQQHHYLGHKVSVGRCMKFLIHAGQAIVGAASLADSAWNVADRDKALRHLGWTREDTANNGRFLILPHVKVKNLASRCLSILAKEGVRAWNDYYACKLKCLETFVDTVRFEGISYKAANWVLVGTTKGYRKSGASFHNSQTPKLIFLYPLDPRNRQCLKIFQNECVEKT